MYLLDTVLFFFCQANAIIMKVQSNLAASEKFFVEEQTRQSLVSQFAPSQAIKYINSIVACLNIVFFIRH